MTLNEADLKANLEDYEQQLRLTEDRVFDIQEILFQARLDRLLEDEDNDLKKLKLERFRVNLRSVVKSTKRVDRAIELMRFTLKLFHFQQSGEVKQKILEISGNIESWICELKDEVFKLEATQK